MYRAIYHSVSMKILIPILLFLSFSITQADFNAVREFQKAIIKEEITGSNVAMVFHNGRTVYYHEENSLKPGDKNITPDTIFRIFSMSKPVTTVAMMMLHERGLVDFDDPVSKYMPQFKDLKCKGENGVYDCTNELKIIHLMTHRSGYRYQSSPSFKGVTSPVKYKDLEAFVEDVAELPLEFEPGSQYQYGINQAILGRVIEVISGMSFYEFLKENLFDPLGMDRTRFYVTDPERQNLLQPEYINARNQKGFGGNHTNMTYYDGSRAYFGGEGLVSTMLDYSKFCRMLVDGGTFEGNRIISQKSIDLMTEKQSEGFPLEENAEPELLGFYRGFSLFVLEDPEADGVNATEGIYGWSGAANTHFWIDPEKKLFGLFMTQARDFSWNLQKRFRQAVYSSVD